MDIDDRRQEGAGIRRRELLIAGAATGLALVSPINHAALARERRLPRARHGVFAHGVSSGYPSHKGATVWTRVSELERSSRLTLEVARDRRFRDVVKRREVIAEARRDFTVHHRLGGLQPGRQYFYRFETKGSHSRIGRFRTLPPPDSKRPVRVAFFSCQSYESGYYTAHAALAREEDIDLVVCLGDYVYEHHFYDGPADRVDRTGVNRDGDAQLLSEYRQKYRLYQSDPNLQEMHAAHPVAVIWDDHEVEDNYNGRGTSSRQKDPALDNTSTPRRVGFAQRRANGYRAFFEAMPRMRPKRDRDAIYGSLRLGGMAELFLTDQRRYRDPQPCDDRLLAPCPDYASGRTMLGPGQKAWIQRAVPGSTAAWKLWGSQVMMMALQLPKGVPANPDQWDGYASERQEILSGFRAAGVRDLAVLSGDIHTFFAGDLTTTGDLNGEPAGVELVGGSITSKGIPEEVGIPGETLVRFVPDNDPHIAFADFTHRGYGVVTARRDKLIAELKGVESSDQPTSAGMTLARFEVPRGTPQLIPA